VLYVSIFEEREDEMFPTRLSRITCRTTTYNVYTNYHPRDMIAVAAEVSGIRHGTSPLPRNVTQPLVTGAASVNFLPEAALSAPSPHSVISRTTLLHPTQKERGCSSHLQSLPSLLLPLPLLSLLFFLLLLLPTSSSPCRGH